MPRNTTLIISVTLDNSFKRCEEGRLKLLTIFGLLQKDAGALSAVFRKYYGMNFHESAHYDIGGVRRSRSEAAEGRVSAVFRSINPDWSWILEAHRASVRAETTRWLLWLKAKDAEWKPPRNQPKLIPGLRWSMRNRRSRIVLRKLKGCFVMSLWGGWMGLASGEQFSGCLAVAG